MLGNKEIGLYIDNYASSRSQGVARKIADECRSTSVVLVPSFSGVGNLPHGILITGGEGSIQRIIQYMVESNQVRPIGLLGGGTHNTLRHSLQKAGKTLSSGEFRFNCAGEGERLHLSPDHYALIQPGLLGSLPFITRVGLGNFEQGIGQTRESLRNYPFPRKVKSEVAYVVGLIKASLANKHDSPPFDMYTISPSLARKIIFPHQSYEDDSVTHTWIKAESRMERIRALLKTALCWELGKPSEYVQVEQARRFEVRSLPNDIWIDGDIQPNIQRPSVVVKRSEQVIPIVAIA